MKPFPLVPIVSLLFLATVHVANADSYKEAVLRDNPCAYYRLNETANSAPVVDEVGSSVGTFVNGPEVGVPGAIANDPENKAVSFSRAKAQYIQLTDLGKFGSSMTGGFTLEYWLKTANFTDHQTVVGTANGPGFVTDCLVDIAYEGNQKRLRMYIRDNHENRYGADCYPGGKNIDIYDNSWHHIVHVYTPKSGGANDRLRFYVDGVRQAVTMMHKRGIPVFSDFNQPVTLGVMDLRGAKPDHLDGSLDEVAFYQQPLSAEQIMNHYRASGAGMRSDIRDK